MTAFAIRPVRDDELGAVRDSWTRSFAMPETNDREQGKAVHVKVGVDGKVTTWWWYAMHRAYVRTVLEDADVLVATLQGHRGDEMVAWCAVTRPSKHPLVVHYIHTISPMRRRGAAKALLNAALMLGDGRPVRYSHRSPIGDYMIDTIHRTSARMHGEAAMR